MAFTPGIGERIVDFNLEVSAGNVPGIASINKFGRNANVDSGSTEEIWDGSAVYVFPATALMTSMSQTTDQAAMRGKTIELQGLDANWAPVTQTAVLGNPTTGVITLGTPMLRCFRMRVLADVVGDSPIRCHNAAETQDYAIISIGNNQTEMAIYTVPAGETAYVTNYYATNNPGVGAPTTLNIKLWYSDRANLYAKQLQHVLGISADLDAYGQFQHFFVPYIKIEEKGDLFITATTANAAADVSAGFDLFLVDN